MPDLSTFDPKRRLVLTSAQLVNGHELAQGDRIAIVDEESDQSGELTESQARLLYQQGTLVHSDTALATPVETAEQYAERSTVVDDLGDGKFLIRAPWLGEGEIVTTDKLDERRQAIIDLAPQPQLDLTEQLEPAPPPPPPPPPPSKTATTATIVGQPPVAGLGDSQSGGGADERKTD